MKTLLLTLEYPPWHGGVANYYGNLVKYWPEPDGIMVLNNNRGELLSQRWPFGWLKAVIKLRPAVRLKPISHVLVGQILPLGTAALICSRFCKIKYSVVLHGLDFTCAVKSYRKKFLSKIILIGAKQIICTNSYVAKTVKQTFPNIAQKIMVVNPGAESLATRSSSSFARSGEARQLTAQFKEKYNLHDKIILLSVGRLVKRKGFDKVIEAMPEILKQAPNLLYVILGDGEEINNFKFKISNFKLNNFVKIISNAQNEERDAWYNISDIFIMPARNIQGDFEGFGIVYLEANLAGKPVIAGKSGGAEDAVIDGLNGLLIDPENIKEISRAVIKLALNSELRQKLGRQGRERAINDFDWEKQINKIYNAII